MDGLIEVGDVLNDRKRTEDRVEDHLVFRFVVCEKIETVRKTILT